MQKITHQLLHHENKPLEKLFSKLKELSLWNQWLKEALGEEAHLTLHCQIVGIDKKSIIVIADSAHWVTRFRFHLHDILPKLKAHPEFSHVQAICCKVRPEQHRSSIKKKRTMAALSDENRRILQETIQKIQDPKLRASLEKLSKEKK